MARRVRPTLRCLREDLGQAIPRADTPLDEIEHPLLVKGAEQFADDETPHERIAAIDDRVLLKVKVQRWTGGCVSVRGPEAVRQSVIVGLSHLIRCPVPIVRRIRPRRCRSMTGLKGACPY